MKRILHLCLANFYIDNYSYQENILPKEHKNLGYEVLIVASTESFDSVGNLTYLDPCEYLNEDQIKVIRIPYLKILPKFIMKKIRSYTGLTEILNEYNPHIIFIHDVQFLDAYKIRRFVYSHPDVEIFADCHADFSNSARGFFSREVLHKIFYRFCANILNQVVKQFWGVLPSRVKFLNEVYHLPRSKIDLLLMGAEEKYMSRSVDLDYIKFIQIKYSIPPNSKIVVTGGKIDRFKKEILTLMESFSKLQSDCHLIIFGTVDIQLLSQFNQLLRSNVRLHYLEWLTVDETYRILSIADLAVFPGRHSVLWEQCVGIGIPMVLKHWPFIDHLDLGGNVSWLKEFTTEAIASKLDSCLSQETLDHMKSVALSNKRFDFSYTRIAKKSIGLSE